jgi:CMP-N,N'-diacetyllegionaminic acid synthase
MRTLAVVPARAGSKGIPGKNKRLFMGKPLVSWAIEIGKRTCNRVCVTSDDPDILDIADEYGVEGLARPAELAQDDTPMLDVLKHALACQAQPSDAVVLLQPTQPLRTDEQVEQALLMLNPDRADSVVSVVQIPQHMSPDFAYKIDNDLLSFYLPGNVTRRQDCRAAYYRDGTVYAMRTALLRDGYMYGRCVPMVVPVDQSCTIDDESDWVRAEEMWRRQHGD